MEVKAANPRVQSANVDSGEIDGTLEFTLAYEHCLLGSVSVLDETRASCNVDSAIE